jgi:autotransporter-associated beta strand protein
VDNLGIGNSGSRSSGTLTAGSGTLTIRGTAGGSSASALTIGVSDSFSINDTTTSVLDASAGTLDARFNNVIIGKDSAGGAARGVTVNATLKMAAGGMSAATMTLGNLIGAYTGAGSYNITSLLDLNGTGTSNITSLTLAQNAASSSPATFTLNSQVNVNGGAILNATSIQQGVVTGVTSLTSRINWTKGTIGNITGGDLSISDVAIVLGGSDTHSFDVSTGQTATVSSTISSLSGSTPLTKAGGGTLVLGGSNTYTGTTTVSAGTLETSTPFLDDASSVEISTGGVLKLGFSGTDIVDSLTFDGAPQTTGTTYGASGSGAAVIDNVHFSGTGKLQVGVITDPFASWVAGFGLTGGDAAKTADPDGDGLSNLLEFALDGNPANGANTGKAVSKIDADHLTLTLPVRADAVFSGCGPLTSDPITALVYTIEGDNDLSGFTSGVEETTALSAGLPGLTTGWTYRTFRLTSTVSSAPKGFLRAGAAEAP